MRVLGIDPGYAIVGWGVVDYVGNRFAPVDFGAVCTDAGVPFERRLDEVYITANKNAIPNDPESPFITSGMRIGTPAVTTRGFGAPEMLRIAEFIWQAATDFDNKANDIRRNVRDICANFPIY